jgi:hypothetical protein
MRHGIWWCMVAALGLVSAAVAAQTPRQGMIAENYDNSKPSTFEGMLGGQRRCARPHPSTCC